LIIYVYQEKEGLLHPNFKTRLADILGLGYGPTELDVLEYPESAKFTNTINSANIPLDYNHANIYVIETMVDVINYVRERPNHFFLGIFNKPSAMQSALTIMGYKWGVNWAKDKISFDYAPEDSRLMNQLHETLHLFGVDDCYEDRAGHPAKVTCSNSLCFMRYGNNTSQVCAHVRRQIKASEQLKQ
jgi:hypothetical protein